ncbi:sulfatase family protein [Methyloversatilis sp. RAC08]|uniref:sulfatase-like hydrolase/transferase n=1 Tax=Methyloversatilis sp. RAC08 TaxID=1842540 RepID=UPI00083D1599|nr:sulfatase-like hydrolase/transferase [Methyloversatilis sp. RAC08]AOF81969.1 sulfatase family protein [Methyloversatilis sp. RAC08]
MPHVIATLHSVLRLLLALIVLNALLAFGNLWPSAWPRPEARLSVELFGALIVLVLWARWRGGVSARVIGGVAALACLWVLLHYIDVTIPALLGRPVNAYWDGQHLWQLARMGGEFAAGWQIAAVLLAACAGLALLFMLVRACVRALAAAAARPRWQLPLAALGTAVLLTHGAASVAHHDLQRMFAPPVGTMVAAQASLLSRALSRSAGEQRLGPGPVFDGDIAALGGADVFVLFAEAYGAITFDRPELAAALAERRSALQHALDTGGRQVVSARVTSPTFGGASWLAHAALLSGIDTHDPDDYALLLTTQRPTLVSHFAQHGYRTIGWMPGLQRPWPEGAFYGFDRLADADNTGYAGLPFGYWRIPDQVSIALLQQQELPGAGHDAASYGLRTVALHAADASAPRTPRFIVFPTLTTHAPFRPVPPYLADPQRLLADDAFSDEDVSRALNAPVSWTDPTPAYIDAMHYQFDWLTRWLREEAPRHMLLIVIGDHQPIGGVTGPNASWEVPVHVIGTDAALLARLETAGFRRGLQPDVTAIGPMHGLTQTLIDAFAGDLSQRNARTP